MIKSVITKVNEFVEASGGYKGVIPIIIAILGLAIALLVLQQNWIKKEWNAVKSDIEEVGTKKKAVAVKQDKRPKKSKEIKIRDSKIKKQYSTVTGFLQVKKEKEKNIRSMIREGDLFFDYDQYEQAAVVYEELTSQHSVFEGSDKVFNRLARSYYNLEDYESALDSYKKVYYSLNSPYKLDAQLGLGKCLIQIGNYDEARRILYFLVGQEAKYKKDDDKEKVVEAYYSIADSYIGQARASKSRENMDN